jgi:hypothetical protein
MLRDRVHVGDCVVDCTAGNGHDTLFLAELVGETGRVFAFDVQPAAIASTRTRLAEAGVLDRCTLHCVGHQSLGTTLPAGLHGKLAAVVFNLGWLPGYDKTCITRTDTTLVAVRDALDWLRVGGLLSIVVYPGHEGGEDEANAIAAWASALPSNTHEVRHFHAPNRTGKSPECWLIRTRP